MRGAVTRESVGTGEAPGRRPEAAAGDSYGLAHGALLSRDKDRGTAAFPSSSVLASREIAHWGRAGILTAALFLMALRLSLTGRQAAGASGSFPGRGLRGLGDFSHGRHKMRLKHVI